MSGHARGYGMKLFGMGSVKELFISMRNSLARMKENMEMGEIFIDEAVPEGTCLPDRTGGRSAGASNETVIYLKWPLKPRMFVEMHPCQPEDWELKLKNGVYGGSMKEAPAPPEETDVLTIPDIERVPVISPVMQEEKLMNVDIITERGIFIGLGAVQASFYLEKAGEEEGEGEKGNEDIRPGYQAEADMVFRQGDDPTANNFTDMPSVSAEYGVPGTFSRDPEPAGIAPSETVSAIFDPEDIYHEDVEDVEIEEPELSDVTSGISGKKEKKLRKK